MHVTSVYSDIYKLGLSVGQEKGVGGGEYRRRSPTFGWPPGMSASIIFSILAWGFWASQEQHMSLEISNVRIEKSLFIHYRADYQNVL